MEQEKRFAEFCAQVCAQVQYVPAHDAIRQELLAHLEDHAEALMAMGVPEEDAVRSAVAAMGDADEIGWELNEQHKPFWGRLLFAARMILLLFLCILLVFLLQFWSLSRLSSGFFQSLSSASDWIEGNTTVGAVEQYPINQWHEYCGVWIHFTEATLWVTDFKDVEQQQYCLHIGGRMYQKNPLQQVEYPLNWQNAKITDDAGNSYYLAVKNDLVVAIIDPTATELYFDCERLGHRITFTIPLEWGGLQS